MSIIERARNIPRKEALALVVRPPTNRRPVCVVSWDPRLPSFSAINSKHWRTMTTVDQYLKDVFPEPPLTAFKRQKNVRDYLIRAKVPKIVPSRPQRNNVGMKKCGKFCHACPFIMEGKNVKSSENFKWKITKHVTCESYNVVCIIQCKKENCKQQYIGETERKLKDRLSDHKGYITNRHMNQPTGAHFNEKGHTIADMKISILEKVKQKNAIYRKERETYLIRKFNSFYKGLNKKP